MKIRKGKLWKNRIVTCILLAGVVFVIYLRQRFGIHGFEGFCGYCKLCGEGGFCDNHGLYDEQGKECFVPQYEKITLTEATDYETIFLQTGLGEAVASRLLWKGDLQTIREAQEDFFRTRTIVCESLIGWFAREDKLQFDFIDYPQFADLQPGDILVTLSTHSAGWRHGHAALVLDENTTVESVMWGRDSTCGRVENWLDYSNWAVLRVKGVTPEMQQEVADFAEEELCGVPYHLSAGFVGEKAPKPDAPHFGVHCSYLVWYAWNYFGYDLDSDGGRLVTASDLLHSQQLEVVQVYGMDPRDFIK